MCAHTCRRPFKELLFCSCVCFFFFRRKANERKLGQLAEGSELLMRTVKEIDVELGLSREQMSALQKLMEDTKGGLSSVMARMTSVTRDAGSRHVFYLVLFIVLLLFLLFYWFRK